MMLLPKSQKRKYGYVDEQGKWVITPQFQFASEFIEGFGRVNIGSRMKRIEGFIKPDGTYLIEPQFDKARDFKNGFAAVSKNKKWGFIKTYGSYLVEPIYDKVWDFQDGLAFVKDRDQYRFLQDDGSFKELNRREQYIVDCHKIQNKDCPGWSFLEAFKDNGTWKFRSWARLLDENQKWYDYKIPEDGELLEVLRYTDIVKYNKYFAEWSDSLNLSTLEEVGELLYANAQQLIIDAKSEQFKGRWVSPLLDIPILIQLYNQLKVIESLGLQELRKKYMLPYEDENYLDAEKVKEMGIRMCEREMLFEEDGFHDLDFMEFIAQSRKPGEQDHFSELVDSEELIGIRE